MRIIHQDDISDWSAPLHSLGAVERIIFTCPRCGRVSERSPVAYGVPAAIFGWPLSRVRGKARCSGACLSQGRRTEPQVAFQIREAGDPWPDELLNPDEQRLLLEWDLRNRTGE